MSDVEMINNKEITEEVETVGEIDLNSKEFQKPAANVLDLLLSKSITEFKVESKKVEITRLSKLFGVPFVLEVRLLPTAVAEKIEELGLQFEFDEDGNPEVNDRTAEQKVMTLIDACYTLEGEQIFKSHQLRKHFNARTNNVLVRKMLLPGEINKLYSRYKELSGNVKTSVKDLKNA